MSSVERHQAISRSLYDQAVAELEVGDFIQCSEKFWGASAHMLKSIAENRGWPHNSHRHFFRIVQRLTQETGNKEIVDLFVSANSLHSNFYEDWMNEIQLRERAYDVGKFIERLASIS